jgi:hypothetical protein
MRYKTCGHRYKREKQGTKQKYYSIFQLMGCDKAGMGVEAYNVWLFFTSVLIRIEPIKY